MFTKLETKNWDYEGSSLSAQWPQFIPKRLILKPIKAEQITDLDLVFILAII